MGLTDEVQPAPGEFRRDISGLDAEGYDNYPPTDELAKFVCHFLLIFIVLKLGMISVFIVMKASK